MILTSNYEVTVKLGKKQVKINVVADTPGEAMNKAEAQFSVAKALGENVNAFHARKIK